jgi:3-deoxy-D-manno-octulosonate 8-phosphate phosphatase (KDO 8-P phosphatase)
LIAASKITPEEFANRAARIEWILSDVDGVMTDGGLYYDRRGHAAMRFNVRDGLGFKLAQKAGLQVGAFSGRRSRALEKRASELGFDELIAGSRDKQTDFDRFLVRHGTDASRVAFIGDDLPDIVVLGRCGLAFAPADAAAEVRAVVHTVLDTRGGDGAVREAVELLLKARGVWEQALAPFTFDKA